MILWGIKMKKVKDEKKYCLKAQEFFKRANQKFVVGIVLVCIAAASAVAGAALLFHKQNLDKKMETTSAQTQDESESIREYNENGQNEFNYGLAALSLFTLAGVAAVSGKACEMLGDSDQMRGYQAQNEEENW